ncbi:MFS transporter [Curtobacterium sp. VKM Ac-2861]|nr:MFS transporter [Curtobacterium sp. VKM Ac-2861]
MTTTERAPSTGSNPIPQTRHRWWVLVAVSVAQLMVVLDSSIVNIALPAAQADLGFDDAGRQWIVTGYALSFGSLLLLAGRLNDLIGRRRSFLIGLAGFAAASALAGFAPDFGVLVTARILQGTFAALLAPAGLSLLTSTFRESKERARALGIFGAIAGAGGAVGLLLGGVLTEYTSWRWCLYVNLFFAGFAFIAGRAFLPADVSSSKKIALDLPGSITAVLALFGVVYGLGNAENEGWTSPLTLIPLIGGGVLLAVFVLIERRASNPLLPLRLVADRTRGGAYIVLAITGAGMFGIFLFLTYYLIQALGFTSLQTGAAFMPMVAALVVSASIIGVWATSRFGARVPVAAGGVIVAFGMFLLTRLQLDSTYLLNVVPALVIIGLGLGLVFSAVQIAALAGVETRDGGAAGAMVNTMQQIGGSIGIAVLSAVSAGQAAAALTGSNPTAVAQAEAALAGYHAVFWCSLGFFLLASLAALLLIKRGQLPQNPDIAVAAH